MELVCMSRRYNVEVEVEDFIALERAESILYSGPLVGRGIDDRLALLDGVFDIEYNGHFGATIFFSIEAEYDTPTLHAKIVTIIQRQIKAAHKYSGRIAQR